MTTKFISIYRIWILLALAFFLWATFTFVRPWTSYIGAMQNGVSSITYRLEGSYVVTSVHHTRTVQNEIEVADYTGHTPIVKKWSSVELYILTGFAITTTILVLLFSIRLFRIYSRRNVIGFSVCSVVWYVIIAVGSREILPLLAIGWLLCAALTIVFTFIVYKRQSGSVTP